MFYEFQEKMLTQNQIKQIKSLQQKKFRLEKNQFVAEGPKLVEELMSNSSYSFDCVYAKNEWLSIYSEKLKEKSISFIEVNDKEIERRSGLNNPNLVLAGLKIPEVKLSDKIVGSEFILVLDQIKDPGNMGTIIRTADWFGINHIVCSDNSVDIFNPKVVQATMGSISRVNIFYTDILSFLTNNQKKATIYGAFTNGENIHNTKIVENSIIVIGNESNGISEKMIPLIHKKIAIPMNNNAKEMKPESLNASIATAIFCYEFSKKR